MAGCAILVYLCLSSRQANIAYIVFSILLLIEVFCLGMHPVSDRMETQFPDSEPTVSSTAGSRLGTGFLAKSM